MSADAPAARNIQKHLNTEKNTAGEIIIKLQLLIILINTCIYLSLGDTLHDLRNCP
ncbi:protein of unknown function [Pseudomonas sp. JV241A]|nr:protein of unknown function [Pseudomonas sp. JV241A]